MASVYKILTITVRNLGVFIKYIGENKNTHYKILTTEINELIKELCREERFPQLPEVKLEYACHGVDVFPINHIN